MVGLWDSGRCFVCVGCWYPRPWSGVKDTGLLNTLLWGALPKAHVFAREPEMFVSVNL